MVDGQPCPHCHEDMEMPSPAPEHNVLSYGGSVVTITLCCGKAVLLRRVQRIAVEAYAGPRTEDDWGKPIKQGDV